MIRNVSEMFFLLQKYLDPYLKNGAMLMWVSSCVVHLLCSQVLQKKSDRTVYAERSIIQYSISTAIALICSSCIFLLTITTQKRHTPFCVALYICMCINRLSFSNMFS